MRHFLRLLCTLFCQSSAIVKDSPKTALESVRSFRYLSLGDVGINAVDRADLISRYLTGDNDICQAYSRRAAAGVILFRTSGVAMGWAGGQSPGAPLVQGPRVPGKNWKCMGVLCTWVKLVTNLLISGCELHRNAFGGRPHCIDSYNKINNQYARIRLFSD